jgi:hypothetical protein
MIEPRFYPADYSVLAGPQPTSLSQAGERILKNFPAPLSPLGERLGVRAVRLGLTLC